MFFKDFRRIKKLGKYLTKDKKTIYLILIVLLPVSFSGAIQPLLVGQAITILKNESTDVWLSKTFFGQSINAIILTLFVTVLFRLVLQGYQTYNIQAVGQRLTARMLALKKIAANFLNCNFELKNHKKFLAKC